MPACFAGSEAFRPNLNPCPAVGNPGSPFLQGSFLVHPCLECSDCLPNHSSPNRSDLPNLQVLPNHVIATNPNHHRQEDWETTSSWACYEAFQEGNSCHLTAGLDLIGLKDTSFHRAMHFDMWFGPEAPCTSWLAALSIEAVHWLGRDFIALWVNFYCQTCPWDSDSTNWQSHHFQSSNHTSWRYCSWHCSANCSTSCCYWWDFRVLYFQVGWCFGLAGSLNGSSWLVQVCSCGSLRCCHCFCVRSFMSFRRGLFWNPLLGWRLNLSWSQFRSELEGKIWALTSGLTLLFLASSYQSHWFETSWEEDCRRFW